LGFPAHFIVKIGPISAIAKANRLRECPPLLPIGRAAALSKDRAMIPLQATSLRLASLMKTTSLNSAIAAGASVASRFPRATTIASIAALALLVLPAVSACSKDSSSSSAATVPSSASDAVVARVNGTEIRESDLTMAEDDLGENVHQLDSGSKREQLVAYVTDIVLVTKAAEKKNLQDSEEFKRRQAFLRNKMLMGLMLQDQAKNAVTDEEMHKVYDDAVKTMTAEEEVRARHILVDTEDEAKALVEQIKGGADFATLAKEKSKDPGAADGGDLGYFVKSQMVPEFSEVAFKMYAGQVSNPVKTQFGWHIIKVEDKRTRAMPEFDKVKDQIATYVARKAQTDFIAQLREGAKIERLDKPATPPAAPAPK
jgi:peptidyl-prolyl cis-trans isomerase C